MKTLGHTINLIFVFIKQKVNKKVVAHSKL